MGMYDDQQIPVPTTFAIGDRVIKPNGSQGVIFAVVVNDPSRKIYYTAVDEGYYAEELRAA